MKKIYITPQNRKIVAYESNSYEMKFAQHITALKANIPVVLIINWYQSQHVTTITAKTLSHKTFHI